MSHVIHTGSNLDVLPTLPDNSIDAIVTDPPYELGFMGKSWDSTGIAYNVALWKECLRVLKPGGHLLAFSGSRTYHRMTCAIEDAGFEIRDQMMWVYGSGFPKSHNIGKAVDKLQGNERVPTGTFTNQPSKGGHHGGNTARGVENTERYVTEITKGNSDWEGWGTALKPAHEPICMARKPLDGTVANNVIKWGVGGINIDATRVCVECGNDDATELLDKCMDCLEDEPQGRFPANLMHDGSPEVLELFPGQDIGSAARFFYCPKASKSDRDEGCEALEDKEWKTEGACIPERSDRPFNPSKNNHPTVKPTELMRYLCRLITPPGGTVLDPFNGSGSTGKAAVLEGFNYVGIELNPEYVAIAEARIKANTKP
jgi:hypothetical protein